MEKSRSTKILYIYTIKYRIAISFDNLIRDELLYLKTVFWTEKLFHLSQFQILLICQKPKCSDKREGVYIFQYKKCQDEYGEGTIIHLYINLFLFFRSN